MEERLFSDEQMANALIDVLTGRSRADGARKDIELTALIGAYAALCDERARAMARLTSDMARIEQLNEDMCRLLALTSIRIGRDIDWVGSCPSSLREALGANVP